MTAHGHSVALPLCASVVLLFCPSAALSFCHSGAGGTPAVL
jgi:hypothetical protein